MSKYQSGQIVVVLLLTILVGLSIGLVITQKTITDVSTSTQTEQSSRAFSAAEAGLERAISGSGTQSPFPFPENNSTVEVRVNANLPNDGQALEYPKPIDKSTVAQFWLSNLDTLAKDYPQYVTNNFVNLYFGVKEPLSPNSPAIEVTTIYLTGGVYSATKEYYDSNQTARSGASGITQGCTQTDPSDINTTNSPNAAPNRPFKCKVQINLAASGVPIMIRARFLYSTTPQPIALAPSPGNHLPYQASIYYSNGVSGQSQKLISLFKLKKMMPSFMDFAIFSNSDIIK